MNYELNYTIIAQPPERFNDDEASALRQAAHDAYFKYVVSSYDNDLKPAGPPEISMQYVEDRLEIFVKFKMTLFEAEKDQD